MKSMSTLSKRAQPLLVGLVVALAVHGLFFSYFELRRSRRQLPGALQSRDNTSELLQFSSQVVATSNPDFMPLPQARLLPPPPAVKRQNPNKESQKVLNIPAKKITQLDKKKKIRTYGPLAARPSAQQPFKDLPIAAEDLRRFITENEHATEVGSKRTRTDNQFASQGQRLILNELSPEHFDAFNKLWSDGLALPRDRMVLLTNHRTDLPIEIRSVPLRRAQKYDFPVSHQQIVSLDDRTVLFWIDNQTLWILNSVRSSTSSINS